MGGKLSTKNQKLEKAIQARKLKLVKKWIKKGANPNGYSKKSNYSFLSMAITLREEALVEILLKKGANPNQKSWLPISKDSLDNRNSTDEEYPIHIAAAHGNIKIMQALLNSEIDINKGQDHKQGTALHQAARFGHSKLAELLLANGADIIGIDSRLNIPLHIAATFGQVKVAEVLIQHGSPIDTSNIRSWTPLHYASSEGAMSMTKLLLKHGAKPTSKDNTGHTPIGVAKTEDMIRLVLEHAVDVAEDEETKMRSERLSVTGPPKPTRTFAYSTKTRQRSLSQAIETTSHLSAKKQSIHSSRSYSDFGRWMRLRQNNKVREEIQQQELQHRCVRRTKSAPKKKYPRLKKLSKTGSNGYRTDQLPKRSHSLRERTDEKVSVKKKCHSFRYRNVNRTQKVKLADKENEVHDKCVRSKSTPLTRGRPQNKKLCTPKQQNQKRINPSVATNTLDLPKNEEMVEKTSANRKAQTQIFGALSRSLQNFNEITEIEQPPSPDMDANHNIAPKKNVKRTKSEGRGHSKQTLKEIWMTLRPTETIAAR